MTCTIDSETIAQVISFHGHSCPGLALGIRVSEAALKHFSGLELSDLVAVVETDMCGVDAIQFLTGCTFGKGNLIHKDYGKMAFSFFHRPSGKGMRLLLDPAVRKDRDEEMNRLLGKSYAGEATPQEEGRLSALRSEMQELFLSSGLEELFISEVLDCPPPRPPEVLQSLTCEDCGESTMESRTRRFAGRTLCLPCFEKVEQKM